MVGGLFIIITSQNYLKKVVGLAIFQTAVFVFFVSLATKRTLITPKKSKRVFK